ncbi:MAG: bifunctional metallophosphatase/5'-nucleotidase [Balneolaceae bacterium]
MLKHIFYFLLIVLIVPDYALAQEKTPFTILHTNDEHSHLISHPAVDHHPEMENPAIGGFARLGGMVQQIRDQKSAVNEPVLLLSGGDFVGGPAFGWLALNGYAAELNLMHQIGYDAVVTGNHEFDFGTKVLADYLKTAGYPEAHEQTTVLGTNLIIPKDHPLDKASIKKTMMKTLDNGLRVGIFGLIGEDAISKTASPEPVTFELYLDAANQAVQDLQDQGADVIISVNHSGEIEDQILAREVEGIDVIVGGHFHTPLFEPITEGNTIIVQAGSYTEYLGQLELNWLPEEDRVEVRNQETENPFLIRLDHTTPVDPEIEQKVNHYEELLNEWVAELTDGEITDIRETIARSDFPLNRARKQESAMGNFITDAMRMVTNEVTGQKVDVAVQANGAIRGNINPGSMPWSEGEISFYDLMTTTGLGSGPDSNPGYPIVSFYLTGEEIRNAMEVSVLLSEMLMDNYFLQFSGASMEYDANRALWMTIPVIDQPLPSSSSVLSAKIFEGNGIQQEDGMRLLEKDDQNLYHVVTDYYIAGFLPMVGDMLPSLGIVFKNSEGELIELDDAIVMQDGNELKVWQTVIDYATSFSISNESGNSIIPDKYRDSNSRLIQVDGGSLWFWPSVVLLLLILGGVMFFVRRKK